jgi:hypothetical protein
MSKLDLVLQRVRQLPAERQDIIAAEIDLMLREDADIGLTDEQWADLRERMALPQGEPIAHADIVAEMEGKFGR